MKHKKKPVLSIVIPCFNEQDVLLETSNRLLDKLRYLKRNDFICESSFIVFVDDGSMDLTWEIIKKTHTETPEVCGLQLSINKGQQHALLAGLLEFKDACDCIISMDADLQDDINAIDEFILKFKEGSDVVYGIRKTRNEDTFFKKSTALFYYRLMSFLGVNIKYNHAHYRLLSKRILDALSEYNEVNPFLRGIIPLIGFNSAEVYYERRARYAGDSKYSTIALLNLAWESITSFSVTPLKMVSSLGFIISILSLIAMIYALFSKYFGYAISGWSSLLISIWFLGGLQLVAIGVVGQYIGKIYQETKQRPKYFVKEKLINVS